jgi:hypothetical protein
MLTHELSSVAVLIVRAQKRGMRDWMLILATDGGEWSYSRSGRFIPETAATKHYLQDKKSMQQ